MLNTMVKITFLFQSGSTIFGQNCLFQLEFGDLSNLKFSEYDADNHFFYFRLEVPFFSKFGPK